MRLDSLTLGQRFRLTGADIFGTLVRVDRGSATVRLEGSQKQVEFTDAEGESHSFAARSSRMTQWSRGTPVEVGEGEGTRREQGVQR